jgi:ubiquinone/menaquinone biosynthesis C-methylase UbiE
MNHTDHVNLIRAGVSSPGGIWADFGAGSGAFTLALADVIGASGHIYAVDKDGGALRENQRALGSRFPDAQVDYLNGDFTRPLNLPPLDGIIMANALHFNRHKEPILHQMLNYLKPGGRFILIEYNADSGNPWVPYPLSYATWAKLAADVGLTDTRQLAVVPSRFLREIYSAGSVKKAQ